MWVLVLAASACASTPALVTPVLEDATASSGVVAQRGRAETETYPYTGAAWADTDGDGYEDVYLTAASGPNVLLRNRGDGTFELSQWIEDVDLPLLHSGRAAFADADADGWPDLAVANVEGVVLFHNLAGEGFADVTAAAGLAHAGGAPAAVAWGDADADGLRDLVVAGDGTRLYRNAGDGTFVDATAALPPALASTPASDAVVADVDGDGHGDTAVTSDAAPHSAGLAVSASAVEVPAAVASAPWRAVTAADVDADGHVDLMLAGRDGVEWLRGSGTSRLVPAGAEAGLSALGPATDVTVVDLDGDGRLDLYVSAAGDAADAVVLQTAPGHFADASDRAPTLVGDGGGAAAAAPDADGRVWLAAGGIGAAYRMLRTPGP